MEPRAAAASLELVLFQGPDLAQLLLKASFFLLSLFFLLFVT
jgi:hypothetical protein